MSGERTLAVTCGLPGVGKTTVAEAVADQLDAALYRTDVVRKELLSDPEYTPEETRMVYDELLDRGRQTVEGGRNAVLDGTFFKEGFREQARQAAAAAGVQFRLVKVECAESVVKERIRARTDDESDADFDVYMLHKESFEPVQVPHVTVDNSDGLEATRRQVAEHF